MPKTTPLKVITNEYGHALILHPNGDTTLVKKGDQIGVGVLTLPTWFPGTLAAVLHDHGYEAMGGSPQEYRFMVDRNLWLNWIAEINEMPWYMTLWAFPMSLIGRFIVRVCGGKSAWDKHKIKFDKPKYGLKDKDIIDIPENFELQAMGPEFLQQQE